MAFNTSNLYNVDSGPPGNSIYVYKYGSETVEALVTAGYFNNTDDDQNLAVGDIIFCTGDLGTFSLRISAVSNGSVSTAMEKAGNITSQTLYKQLSASITGLGKGALSPTLSTWIGGISQFAFAGTGGQEDEGYFNFHLPHDIKPNVAHSLHLHWGQNVASPSGDVKWEIEYTVIRSGNSEIFPATTTVSIVDTVGVQYENMVAFGITIPASAQLEPDAIFMGRLGRPHGDAADTSIDPSFAFNLDFIYQVASQGTLEAFRPFLSTGFSA